LKIAAILPAYNEAERVANVARIALRCPSVDEVIVVNDGSSDNTSEVVKSLPGVRLVNLPKNRGKGGAMAAGVAATDAHLLVFLDADLIGLRCEHVESLIEPVRTGKYQMAVGRFRGGRKLTDWAQRLTPNISGQRAIRRDVFAQIPDLDSARYGVEMAITRYCHRWRVPSLTVWITGVTHPMKEEKLGFFRGMFSRARMYVQILDTLLDPREPRRVRARRPTTQIPRILKTLAANQRRQGRPKSAMYWLYRQERSWHRRKSKSSANWRFRK
jgi:glycosyltransferase involved in cell wall biosynthesis